MQYHLIRGRPDPHMKLIHFEVQFVQCIIVPSNMQYHLVCGRPDPLAKFIYSHTSY